MRSEGSLNAKKSNFSLCTYLYPARLSTVITCDLIPSRWKSCLISLFDFSLGLFILRLPAPDASRAALTLEHKPFLKTAFFKAFFLLQPLSVIFLVLFTPPVINLLLPLLVIWPNPLHAFIHFIIISVISPSAPPVPFMSSFFPSLPLLDLSSSVPHFSAALATQTADPPRRDTKASARQPLPAPTSPR